jgi:hypothetical protein
MSSKYYSRPEVVELLEIDTDFLVSLERESILSVDAPPDASGEYSARMLERVRVAHNLIQVLDVNLPGAGIIIRMREQLVEQRQELEQVLRRLGLTDSN